MKYLFLVLTLVISVESSSARECVKEYTCLGLDDAPDLRVTELPTAVDVVRAYEAYLLLPDHMLIRKITRQANSVERVSFTDFKAASLINIRMRKATLRIMNGITDSKLRAVDLAMGDCERAALALRHSSNMCR